MARHRSKQRIKRRKRRNRGAWFCTGIMFLILVGILLFRGGDIGKGGKDHAAFGREASEAGGGSSPAEKREDAATEAAEAGAPVYLESIADIDPGTVLDAGEIDLARAAEYFTVSKISDDIFQYIHGKSYVENDKIRLDDLRYLKVLHYNYDHEIQVGELIVNRKIAKDCRKVFRELFSEEYEIASIYLIDRFWTGDSVDSDTNSIEHNNTSAFNYRVVPNTDRLSNHAAGFAIDINPLQNPYVKYNGDGSFAKYYKDMEKYTDREQKGKHMITHDDICYQVFAKHGFTWGGDWNNSKDYQHFEKKEE